MVLDTLKSLQCLILANLKFEGLNHITAKNLREILQYLLLTNLFLDSYQNL